MCINIIVFSLLIIINNLNFIKCFENVTNYYSRNVRRSSLLIESLNLNNYIFNNYITYSGLSFIKLIINL